MRFTNRCLGAEDLVREIAQLLPEDASGAEGPLWAATLRSIFREMARARGIEMREPRAADAGSDPRLNALWYDGDGLLLAAESGWGDQSDLERSFANLMLLKSPQKVLVYASPAGQNAVIEQLTTALLRYPHHIEGEQYIAVNLLAAQGRVYGMMCEAPHDGSLDRREASFLPVPGSPFSWRLAQSAARK